jgi:hypothetical protein
MVLAKCIKKKRVGGKNKGVLALWNSFNKEDTGFFNSISMEVKKCPNM